LGDGEVQQKNEKLKPGNIGVNTHHRDERFKYTANRGQRRNVNKQKRHEKKFYAEGNKG